MLISSIAEGGNRATRVLVSPQLEVVGCTITNDSGVTLRTQGSETRSVKRLILVGISQNYSTILADLSQE